MGSFVINPPDFYCMQLMMVLFVAKLIIYGEFVSVTNSTRTEDPKYTDVVIQTTVHYVLRNDDNVDVSSSIVIEDHEHPQDGRCVNNLRNLRGSGMCICLPHVAMELFPPD